MNIIIYAVGIVFAAILAPVVGLMIAFLTFFTSTFAFIRGFHLGMKINLFIKTAKKQPQQQDIWEKHINRIENKKY
jgi:phosphate/sulfate permease